MHTVPGDAVIVLNHTPHAPTYILSDEPRMMVYFRITAARAKEDIGSCPAALVDIWSELPGMADIIEAERGVGSAARL